MCDFKPGDEVVCVDAVPRDPRPLPLCKGQTYTVIEVFVWFEGVGVNLAEVDAADAPGFWADRFRKVERRTDTLSIESFLTIKWGFEEPKRAPAKKRERA